MLKKYFIFCTKSALILKSKSLRLCNKVILFLNVHFSTYEYKERVEIAKLFFHLYRDANCGMFHSFRIRFYFLALMLKAQSYREIISDYSLIKDIRFSLVWYNQ
jgi:hypothetical protein